MNVSEKYFEEKLYPLQNGVLNLVQKAETRFFLTGGTALSRYYTHHRYSDDLDLFVINAPKLKPRFSNLKNYLDASNEKTSYRYPDIFKTGGSC